MTTQEIPPYIGPGFVRILNDQSVPVGCGFVISECNVCTCAHVVAAALKSETLKAPDKLILLDFPYVNAGEKHSVRVVPSMWWPLRTKAYRAEDGIQDIALLEFSNSVPKGVRPLRVSTATKVWKHRFGAYGYPKERPGGTWASGQLLGTDDSGLLQLQQDTQIGHSIQQGFSGTPVWDTHIGAVVGFITLAERDKRVAFAIPISFIHNLLSRPIPSSTLGEIYQLTNDELNDRLEIYQHIVSSFDASATDILDAALIHLRLNNFKSSIDLLKHLLGKIQPRNAYASYALALAMFQLRRPFVLHKDEASIIQDNLLKAINNDNSIIEAYILLALTKYDYFYRKGFRVAHPTIEQCLSLADQRIISLKEFNSLKRELYSLLALMPSSKEILYSLLTYMPKMRNLIQLF